MRPWDGDAGTFPLDELSLEEKIGQLLMASLDGLTLDTATERFLAENHIGNIVHFGNNARDPEQTLALNNALQDSIRARSGIPAMIGIDHEGGRVMRFRDGATWFPSAMAIGATNDEKLAEDVGRAMGEELRAMGFHINFAPGLDVNTNPANPVIGVRSFGDDPKAVARLGSAMVRGMRVAGLIAGGKHFPGHGDTAVDSHFGLPTVNRPLESLLEVELFPFAEAIRQGMDAVMTSHILYPAIEPENLPATMSRRILDDLLRGRMGFHGLVVSDAMHMRAIQDQFGLEHGCVVAVNAGVDVLCIGTGGAGYYDSQACCYRALMEAATSGALPMARIDEAVRRVLAAKAWALNFNGAPALTLDSVDWAAHDALGRRGAEASVTRVHGGKGSPVKGSVLCVSEQITELRFGVGEGDWRTLTFAEMAKETLGNDVLLLTEGADVSVIDDYDAVIVSMSRVDPDGLPIRWLSEAMRRGKRVAAVLTGLPYTASSLPPGCEALCLYGLTWHSARAVCRILRGEIEAQGAVPLKL